MTNFSLKECCKCAATSCIVTRQTKTRFTNKISCFLEVNYCKRNLEWLHRTVSGRSGGSGSVSSRTWLPSASICSCTVWRGTEILHLGLGPGRPSHAPGRSWPKYASRSRPTRAPRTLNPARRNATANEATQREQSSWDGTAALCHVAKF